MLPGIVVRKVLQHDFQVVLSDVFFMSKVDAPPSPTPIFTGVGGADWDGRRQSEVQRLHIVFVEISMIMFLAVN